MIEVKNLCKTYGNHNAVADLTFTIGSGHIYGFLGPNGAGKSTTMNIITGCLAATSGSVTVDGFDILENGTEAKKRIGYLPEQPPVFGDMTPLEYLDFVADVKKISKQDKMSAIEEVMDKTGITGVKGRLIKNLSKGYKQRVGIAQAILGNPSIIILDEPTVGLDPKQIIEIRKLIKELGEEHTVILSSHILSEIQAVCDEILIISAGRLVANDTAQNLENMFEGSATLEITAKADAKTVWSVLNGVEGVLKATFGDSGENFANADITVKDAEVTEKVFFSFAEKGIALTKIMYKGATLEDVFMELTTIDKKIDDSGETTEETDEAEEESTAETNENEEAAE